MTDLVPDHLLDPEAIAALARHAPEGGVLSVYVNADTGADPGLQAAAIDIRNRLGELQRNVESEGPRERAVALGAALKRLRPEIERLTSPLERGRGRVLFADVATDEVTWFASQMPVANRVVLDATPFLHPLLEVLDDGRPAGVVLVSQDEARILEWRLGELYELERIEPTVVEAPHERSGPVGSNPAGRAYSPRREQRAARETARTLRFLDRVGGTATALAGDRDWDRLLVSGGERWTEPLAQAVAARLQEALIRDQRVLIGLDEASLTRTVTEVLERDHATREEQLVRRVRETALARGPAALGLSDVVGALNEGRVAHLLYDPAVRYQGSVTPDGLLLAGTEHPGDGAATPEPRLTERLVERALETGARVTPVEGASQGALAEAEGIAALLRW